jgi:hypothetical protein
VVLQGIIGVTSTLLMDLSPESDERLGLLTTVRALRIQDFLYKQTVVLATAANTVALHCC